MKTKTGNPAIQNPSVVVVVGCVCVCVCGEQSDSELQRDRGGDRLLFQPANEETRRRVSMARLKPPPSERTM